MINILAASLAFISTIIGAFGAILLKKGSGKKPIINSRIFFGLSLYAFSTIIYLIALKREKLSVLYPIISFVYVWISIFSVKMLKEKMNFLKLTGIALIILGVVFIGFGS